MSGWVGTQKESTIFDALPNIDGRCPNKFLMVYTGYDSTRSELYVGRNYAEVQEHFIQFGSNEASAVPLRGTMIRTRINFNPISGASDTVVLYNPGQARSNS